MPATPIYRTAIAAEWIDYNGHVRDAYYALILSYASDALMERLGMDVAYRAATGNTLYTVEMHIHYLREIHHSDIVIEVNPAKKQLTTVGGNVEDTVGKKTWALKSDGTLVKGPSLICIIECLL